MKGRNTSFHPLILPSFFQSRYNHQALKERIKIKRKPQVKRERPINLDLTKFHFPITAIVSILHRVSGVVIFIFLPYLLYLLHQSLISESSFINLQDDMTHPLFKFALWVVLAAVAVHFWAGIRHMLMDLGYAESLKEARFTSVCVFVFSAISIVLLGVWLW